MANKKQKKQYITIEQFSFEQLLIFLLMTPVVMCCTIFVYFMYVIYSVLRLVVGLFSATIFAVALVNDYDDDEDDLFNIPSLIERLDKMQLDFRGLFTEPVKKEVKTEYR